MTLRIGALSLWLVVASAATGCNDKVKLEDKAGSVSSPAESENDTTDETATQAPPAPEADPQGAAPSPNDVWVGGGWRWEGGRYRWLRGRWEARRAGFELIQARWAEEGGHWVHHPARWARGRR